jgi:hypothetical protein
VLGDGVSERQDSGTAGFGRETDDAGTPVMLVFAIQHIERAVTRGTYSTQFTDNSSDRVPISWENRVTESKSSIDEGVASEPISVGRTLIVRGRHNDASALSA